MPTATFGFYQALFMLHVSSSKIPFSQEWFGPMDLLTFLRDIGKHARVNVMMTRESVRQRLARDEGISFTECVLSCKGCLQF